MRPQAKCPCCNQVFSTTHDSWPEHCDNCDPVALLREATKEIDYLKQCLQDAINHIRTLTEP